MTTNLRFDIVPNELGTDLRLLDDRGFIPPDTWALRVDSRAEIARGVEIARDLVDRDNATIVGDAVRITHAAVADLTIPEARALGLGATNDVVAHLALKGLLPRDDFRIALEWRTRLGHPLVGATRVGAWLKVGRTWRRLPAALFQVAEAVDDIMLAAGDEASGRRMAALARVTDLLPGLKNLGEARATGLAANLKVVVADAFSLDLEEDAAGTRLTPILHGNGGETPLLSPAEQARFARVDFFASSQARPVYAIQGGTYVAVTPTLRTALDGVRQLQGESAERKRAVFASPRAFLRASLGDSLDDDALETLFRDTKAYSDRVIGLGLWKARALPWLKTKGSPWFASENEAGALVESLASPALPDGDEHPAIDIGGRPVPIPRAAATEIAKAIMDAISDGRHAVSFEVDGETKVIPATYQALALVEAIGERGDTRASGEGRDERPEPPARNVLMIEPNEEDTGFEQQTHVRADAGFDVTTLLCTTLKPHQVEGVDWLRRAWIGGNPGVLLADDMGLGKTLQALAFLAWLRAGMRAGRIARKPILIVAPTGLLANWRAEVEKHLLLPGLGVLVEAYGPGLARLRRRAGSGETKLDQRPLVEADWILTTYETLRDQQLDFGAVAFACALFDEAQKVKQPGVRITDAAKAVHATFKIAMTGTPIENRLAELWCVTDLVHGAYLGSLKDFSAAYENNPTDELLHGLKDRLDAEPPGGARMMLRRMKRDHLPDLPVLRDQVHRIEMPPHQSDAYEAVIAERKSAEEPTSALMALQRLRAISLHPDVEAAVDDATFIAMSARVMGLVALLDEARVRAVKALVFVEDLAMHKRLSGLLQRRYDLQRPPAVISGEVGGGTRQARVEAFQAAPSGFDVMLLSPKAGGVGLTLTAATEVVHLSRWWNPAVEDQCNGRALRIGQVLAVTAHVLIAQRRNGRPSFDENLHDLLNRKRLLMQRTLAPADASVEERRWLASETLTPV